MLPSAASADLLDVRRPPSVVRRPTRLPSERASERRPLRFPYGDSHGLGVTSGGIAEAVAEDGDPDAAVGAAATDKDLAYELGNLMVTDASAKLGNWWNSDFEKVLSEVVALNPLGAPLWGEAYHDVGQNPRAASSIGATQHTQIMRRAASKP